MPQSEADEELCIGELQFSDGESDDDNFCPAPASENTSKSSDWFDELLSNLRAPTAPPPPNLPPQLLVSPIDNIASARHCSTITAREHIMTARTPIIIEGLPVAPTEVPGGLTAAAMRAALPGDLAVPVRGRGTMRADQFFKLLDAGEAVYLADVSITRHFPWLHRLVRVPAYFMHCFTHRTRETLSVAHDTPSLFVGGNHTISHLHIDQMCSNFWMHLGEGYKHWTTFHPDDAELLRPAWDDDGQIYRFQPLGELERSSDCAGHIAAARRLEFTIGPGDTLFIPWNTPH